jgi:hypothetical protein
MAQADDNDGHFGNFTWSTPERARAQNDVRALEFEFVSDFDIRISSLFCLIGCE